MTLDLAARIEGILFYKTDGISVKRLAAIAGASVAETEDALELLRERLKRRGISLVEHDGEVALTTHRELAAIIEHMVKEDLKKDLTPAGAETLAVILYRGPITKSEIDYIRGVNSSYILENLRVRGLIDRKPNPKDERSYLYSPTLDLFQHLGAGRAEDLPDHERVTREIAAILERKEEAETP